MIPPAAVCILGPTASGKSLLAEAIARRYPAEIISVDSALVYRGMDIGTAKPGNDVLAEIPHHLIDIRDPVDPYSAADFRRDALRLIEEISGRGRVPLFVGGTMLYFKALKDGLAVLPPANPEVRRHITTIAADEGWPAVHRRLQNVDPVAAARIHPNDPQRLQRALEIYEVSGTSMTALQEQTQEPCPFALEELAIVPPDRLVLHQTIATRFHTMLNQGLVDEVRALFEREDLHPGLPAIKAVGYRQCWAHLAGEISFDEMVDKAIAATRQLAKRQFTWLRSWKDLKTVGSANPVEALKILGAGSILRSL